MEICLISIDITLLRVDIYTQNVCYVHNSIVLKSYITNLLTLKLCGFHRDSNQRPFALQPDALSITPDDPEDQSDIFGHILAFSLISIFN